MEKKKKLPDRILRKQTLLFALLLFSLIVPAQQNVIHTGERIQVMTGTDVFIMGSYKDTTTASGAYIINQGTINIQGDLMNNSPHYLFNSNTAFPPTAGTLRFFGGSPGNDARILGNTINLKGFEINLNNYALTSNVLLRTQTLNAYGNLNFYRGGFDLDTNHLILIHDPLNISDGIERESDTGRILLLSNNTEGKISLQNFPFISGSSYDNLKGMGLGFTQPESLGGTPVFTRTFVPLPCGDSIGHIGSIQRVYKLENNSYAAQLRNPRIDFLPSELAGNPYGDSLLIFVSKDKGQSWRQIRGGSDDTLTYSFGTSEFSVPSNYSVITAATNPCDGLPPIQVNQIFTGIYPNDTLTDINEIRVCNAAYLNARVYATGEEGAVFEWKNLAGYYLPQEPIGYFDITALGTYWVKMTNIRGCTDSVAIPAVTAPQANSDFTITPGSACLGDFISVAPTVIDPTVSYEWDFGDGGTSVLDSDTHLYTVQGTYTITLKAVTADSCMSETSKNVVIYSIPVAGFSAGTACPGVSIDFINSTIVNSAPTWVTLTWDFGDDSIATPPDYYNNGIPGAGDISHVYTSGGTYNVTLIAEANGCFSDPVILPVTINPNPVAAFSYSPACEGTSISFTNESYVSDLSPLSYLWDFSGGAGPTSTTENPEYTYNTEGSYSVSLSVTSAYGCFDEITIPVSVYENPVAGFTSANACVNSPASFANTSVQDPGLTYSFSWNFGDSETGTLENESHVYTTSGTFEVSMTITSEFGCFDATSGSVTIYPEPIVSFSALSNCVNSSINFINTSTGAASFLWDFPVLSTTETSVNTVQTFDVAGTFPVYLTGTSSYLCSTTDTGYITIYPLPEVDLGDLASTCGSSYILEVDTTGVHSGCSYAWSNGSTDYQLTALYNGNFSVSVTSPYGCTSTDDVTVVLNEAVVPELGTDSVFCDFTVLDAGYPSPLTQYIWSTGAITQTIDVLTSGTYSVTVTDQNNCTGTSSINITIYSSSPLSLGADTTVCDSDGLTLDAGTGSDFLWNDGSTEPTLVVEATGYYWVQVTNGAGCNSSDTIHVVVNLAPVFTLGDDQFICDQTVLNAFTTNCSYEWNTGATTPAISVFESGTYFVTLTDLTSSCVAFDTVNVVIYPLPVVDLGSDTILCSYQTVSIDAGNPGSSFQWNSGQTTQTITVAAEGVYDVVVTDINGCSSADNMVVQIQPVFTIDLGPEKQYCPGSTIILDAVLTTTGNSFVWENSSEIISSEETYQIADTGMYYLTVTDMYGCVAEDSVKVIPSSTSLFAYFLADSKIEVGDTVKFVNLSYPKPFNSMWYLDDMLVSTDSCPEIPFNMTISPPSDTIMAKLRVYNEYCVSYLSKPIIVDTMSAAPPIAEEPDKPNENTPVFIKQLTLYPNPNTGYFNLYVELDYETPSQIFITSMDGAIVFSEKRMMTTGLYSFSLDNLRPSMYFLTLVTKNDRRTVKFIVIPN